MAFNHMVILGPLIYTKSTYGVSDYQSLNFEMLWDPVFQLQLQGVLETLIRGDEATLPLWPDNDLDDGDEKWAMSVTEGRVVLHKIWFPNRDNSFVKGQTNGTSKTEWKGGEEKRLVR